MLSHQLTFPEPYQAQWIDIDLPEPGPDEILVRTRKTLISTGTELTAYSGDFPPDSGWSQWITYPFQQVGYSNVGDIIAVGSAVSQFAVGQRVVSGGRHASVNLVSLKQGFSSVQLVPASISDDQAVFWQLGKTVMNGVRLAQIALGEAVVLVGMGILGQLALQYVTLSGACPTIAVDLSPARLQIAQRHGATDCLVGGRDALRDEILAITRDRLADVAFEITGNPQVIPWLLQLVRRRGRVILLGSSRHKVEIDFHNEVHPYGLQIIGAHVSTHPQTETPFNLWTPARNGELFFDLVQAGRLQIDDLITHRYDWQAAPEAYHMLVSDRTQALGVVLEDWPQ